ncbi:cobalamin-independent methionine synthase II family protein [Kocuria sp. p3-SID1433]|uniref:cobalamin-independent methionine synthase II family protein n=1 Tax=unclassified Kocuria TaxID=2649579 RepID=UPI0021A91AB8|nr:MULTISPECIES: cobalamin-independent methionine synthase II family protein [unclassified Kocuria]MCT1600928.1 cobalamin-independent methionine synthase II family protein [Kocuria sp. p3-SID1428]MCT2179032.1 cobalamin-independent methionine synthase II family protein [Kocuria sp. p3-SID1433]
MHRSENRILTTHAGSLPRTDQLIEANRARTGGQDYDQLLTESVVDVVQRQKDLGIDVVNDGEYGHAMSEDTDYGAWWHYIFDRLDGLGPGSVDLWSQPAVRSEPGQVRLTSFGDRRDRQRFQDAYTDPSSGISTGNLPPFPEFVGPIRYVGQEAVARDIANLKRALEDTGASEGYLASLSPGSCARLEDKHYGDEDEVLQACAEAMREEYRAITDAGLIVQIDDPSIAENWDQINPEPSVEDYLAFTAKRVEAINYALEGIPADQVRFHLCWGSWHGPHTTDLEFKHLARTMLQINAGAFSFEAANARHEHEWRVWEDVSLPEDKLIIPGIVSHATNVVEHPELVAERIERFASVVGRERVIASTDCGLGGRIHPQIAAAKLEALAQGAEIASSRLF